MWFHHHNGPAEGAQGLTCSSAIKFQSSRLETWHSLGKGLAMCAAAGRQPACA